MSRTRQRTILHVDMDAFYAAIEQRDNPALRGRPLVVGGGARGVVAAASYEARRFGIHSAMPMHEAFRRCPELLRVAPRMAHYQAVSRRVFALFREFTPAVESLSLDEAFLDVTDSLALFGPAPRIAADIKARIEARTGLSASVGVAPNKLVAKIASDLEKPDGLVVVTPEVVVATLDPLPVGLIPGIGRDTTERLAERGIGTIAELRCADTAVLEAVFGRFAPRMRARAAGIDKQPVQGTRRPRSLSAETTFDVDLTEPAAMRRELLRLAERTASRLRARELFAGTVQLKIRRADFTTCSRQHGLNPPANGTAALYQRAGVLLERWLGEHPGAAVRLLGIGGSDLLSAGQADLFETVDRGGNATLDRTVDAIRGRFGALAVSRARVLRRRR